ncbi:MAG TPA: hypothetical protein V6C76_01495 [Drouetiella sp.]
MSIDFTNWSHSEVADLAQVFVRRRQLRRAGHLLRELESRLVNPTFSADHASINNLILQLSERSVEKLPLSPSKFNGVLALFGWQKRSA